MTEEEVQKVTTKQRMIEAVGQSIPIDLFLYSCLEYERTRKAINKTEAHDIGWPPLQPQNLGHFDRQIPFDVALKSLCTWYQQSFSDLVSQRPLDHETLGQILAPIMNLTHDITVLYKTLSNMKLPVFPDIKSTPGIELPEPWLTISRTIQESFPQYANFVSEYLIWTYKEDVIETFEPGSRPPVGRFAPPHIRKDSPGQRGRSRDSGPPSRGRRSPDDQNKSIGKTSNSRGKAPSRSESSRELAPQHPRNDSSPGERPQRERPQKEHSTQDEGPKRRHKSTSSRSERPNADQTKRLTDLSLAEVDTAIERLISQPEVADIKLNPANSFYRRLQHQKIVDAGFVSQSIGEGPERAVQISRTEKKT